MTSIFILLRRPTRLFTRAIPTSEKETSSQSPPRPALQKFEDLPVWYQDNPCVHTHYRPVSYSALSCLYSWTYLHNESLNIYTHLIPAILSVFAQLWLQSVISASFPDARLGDRFVFAVSLGAATTALTLSTLYHTLMPHSYHVATLWLRMDYIGILILILGSFFSGIYVGFFEHPRICEVYWGMIAGLAIVTSLLVLHRRLQGLKWRGLRTGAFVAMGLSGFVPIAHGVYLYGWVRCWEGSGLPFWLGEGVVYGIGAGFFATRFPEKKWPGRFDVWGTSHQIFHVLVVAAAMVHLWGVWSAYGWQYRNRMNWEMES